MRILEVFDYFLNIFVSYETMKLDLQANCGYFQVCVIADAFRCVWKMAFVGQIVGPFLAPIKAKICQYIGFRLFSCKVCTGFTWNLIHKLIRAIFVGVKTESKFRCFEILVFSHFFKISLVSYRFPCSL